MILSWHVILTIISKLSTELPRLILPLEFVKISNLALYVI